MNIAFYISGHSTRLKKFLIKNPDIFISDGDSGFVVSEYEIEEDLSIILQNRNMKIEIFPYESLGTNNTTRNRKFSDKMLAFFKQNRVVYCFSFGSHILSGNLLKEYKNLIINFHPAILPMYPGRKAIDQAVKHGNTLLVGNTAHFIDEGVDTGPIIMQTVIPLQAFEETGDYDKVLDLQVSMLEKIIFLLKSNRIKIRDNKVFIEGADYNVSACFPAI